MKIKIFIFGFLLLFSNIVSHSIYQNVSQEDFREFLTLYAKRPIKNNYNGMKSIGCFWVWYITKTLNKTTPLDLIVESGIWLGQSTWLLEQAAPNARIISIDPKLNQIRYRSPNVFYTTQDFSTIDFGSLDGLTTLCFFDDHINAYSRVMQAYQKGFTYLLFDDNYPPNWGAHYTLAHCLSQKNFLTNQLENIMQEYVVLPNLFENSTQTNQSKVRIEYLDIPLHQPEFNIFKQEAKTYRWTTFVALKR